MNNNEQNPLVLDLRKPQPKEAAPQPVQPIPQEKKENLLETRANAAINLNPIEMQRMADQARKPEENLVWPTPDPNAPLISYGQRRLYYLNPAGKQVVLDEENAFRLHNRMREFHGDQFGNMSLPRFFKKEEYRKGQRTFSN